MRLHPGGAGRRGASEWLDDHAPTFSHSHGPERICEQFLQSEGMGFETEGMGFETL